VAPQAVGLTLKLKLFLFMTLLLWPLTFWPVKEVTGHLPFCQFSACYVLPFST